MPDDAGKRGRELQKQKKNEVEWIRRELIPHKLCVLCVYYNVTSFNPYIIYLVYPRNSQNKCGKFKLLISLLNLCVLQKKVFNLNCFASFDVYLCDFFGAGCVLL